MNLLSEYCDQLDTKVIEVIKHKVSKPYNFVEVQLDLG